MDSQTHFLHTLSLVPETSRNKNDAGDDGCDTNHRADSRNFRGRGREGGGRGGGGALNQITAQPMKLIADAAIAPSGDEWINSRRKKPG